MGFGRSKLYHLQITLCVARARPWESKLIHVARVQSRGVTRGRWETKYLHVTLVHFFVNYSVHPVVRFWLPPITDVSAQLVIRTQIIISTKGNRDVDAWIVGMQQNFFPHDCALINRRILIIFKVLLSGNDFI